jgi:hypothetical protein
MMAGRAVVRVLVSVAQLKESFLEDNALLNTGGGVFMTFFAVNAVFWLPGGGF